MTWAKGNPEKQYAAAHRQYKETAFAPNSRRPWTQAEDKRVLAHSVPDMELVTALGRSLTAIQVRRCRLLGNDTNRTGETDE